MLDRLGNEVDFAELFMEETLSAKDKKEIPDSMYGLVYTDEKGNKVRKFPLNDETHVRQAAIFFDRAKGLSDDQKRELARNIVRRAKELDMDYSSWESLKPYLDKPVKESYDPDPDSTSGTSDFDDSDKEPGDCYCEQTEIPKKFKKILEGIYESVNSKFFPNQFDDYSSSMHFRDELKNFIRLAEPLVTKKGVPFHIESLYYLWKMAKASIDSSAYREYVEKHRYNIEDYDKSIRDYDRRIENYDGSKRNGQSLESLKNARDNVVKLKESKIKYYDWSKNKASVTSSVYQILQEKHFSESFEEMFGPVIQEAFDAITGEEIPINHAYTMEEMAKRTFSESELNHIKHNDEMEHVNKIFFDECYFASPTDYGKSMTLDGPLFVTPYKLVASIFCGRDKVKENIPKIGSYNLGYKEWTDVKVHGANNKPLNKPLKEVHVYVEGYPFLESKTIEAEGFIHCINDKTYRENFYKYPWMAKDDREYLIANTDGNKVEFTRTIKCKVRYIIEGKPARPGQDDLGPRPNGLTRWILEIANKIHTKYKADQKEPTGNQNCLLCAWCAEASIRGGEYLPRPVYSPRDPALEIVPGDIVGGVTKKNPGNFYDMLEHLRGDSIKQPFARWYCHVKWGHGNGGHEFLIVKIDEDAFNIMDPQQGIVRPLNADDSYMKNVDWEETYICRIDDKPFKYMEFDKINDPKKTLPWDPKKDIPYMLKHGMITKEEAERELKRAETNEFYRVLKEKLGQTPIQESALPDGVFLRPATLKDVPTMRDWQLESINARLRKRPDMIEYMEKDARESVPDTKMIMSGDRTIGMLQCCWIDDDEWWYIGEIYLIAEFRGRGIGSTLLLNEISEHDKLRLQVATDNPRAKALYESLGFKTVRTNQDMEVMDLVKTPESVCENMVEQLKSFKYGLGSNGSVHFASSKEYDEKYRLESPEEFEENGGGICYDYVEFMDKYLKEYGYHCRKFYISTDTEDMDTHTFILVNDGKGGYVYPESAFKLLEGTHIVKSPEEAALKVMDKIFDINDNGKKYDEIKYYVWEYEGHPPYGSDMETCHKYFSKGEPFHEGTAKKLK